jgi:hypothetical protein
VETRDYRKSIPLNSKHIDLNTAVKLELLIATHSHIEKTTEPALHLRPNVGLGSTNRQTRITCIFVRGGADKSLARPSYRCRRTESIVSLEKGACSCAGL